jgi:hypothetical protein
MPEDGGVWFGWDISTLNVTADLNVHAIIITPKLPDKFATDCDYLYSDNPNDKSGYTLAEFYSIIALGKGKEFFSIGDKIKIVNNTNAFKDEEIVLQVYGFNHYRLSDSTQFAHVVFGMVGLMNNIRRMNDRNIGSVGGWAATEMRAYLNEIVYPALPFHWQAMIKTVDVLSSIGDTKISITASKDKLFLFSNAEVGFETTSVPYCNEIDAEAENITFPIFTDNNSRIKKYYNGSGNANTWWHRSPSARSGNFTTTAIDGGGGYHPAVAESYGVSFGFCI